MRFCEISYEIGGFEKSAQICFLPCPIIQCKSIRVPLRAHRKFEIRTASYGPSAKRAGHKSSEKNEDL